MSAKGELEGLEFLQHFSELPTPGASTPSHLQAIASEWTATASGNGPLDLTPTSGDGVLLLPMTTKRANWTRRLVVTKQPASEFYKDEGGKSNALEVEVTLVEFNEHGESARSPDEEFVDIPLRILLFFESGKRVDDTDQEIFRFVGNEYDSVVIRAATRKASVQFRLEKVSRRKDGQRFKLRIEVDQEQCTANVADLTPIFTNAICVLSKRKHHTQAADNAANRAKEPPIKILKRDLTKIEEKMDQHMNTVLEEMGRVHRQLQLQNELLAKVFMPSASSISPCHSHPGESSSMEWFLKSGVMEEILATKPLPLPLNTTGLSYLTVSDSDDRDTQSSPTSSDASVVEIPSLSAVSFAEF